MSVAPIHHLAASHRAYLYLALVPIFCLLGWAVLVRFVRRYLSESALYKALDISLYLSAVAVVVLVAIPIRFRKSVSLVELVTASLFCGLVLALITFVVYMTVGFGRISLKLDSSDPSTQIRTLPPKMSGSTQPLTLIWQKALAVL
jgi:F0F1-type ATP synthase membrane subunit a